MCCGFQTPTHIQTTTKTNNNNTPESILIPRTWPLPSFLPPFVFSPPLLNPILEPNIVLLPPRLVVLDWATMFVIFLVVVFLLSAPPATQSLHHHHSHRHHHHHYELVNQTISPEKDLRRLRRTARSYLCKLNKPPLKTIHSPDGDLIDCVPTHLQPAFDHPELKGQRPVDLPERRPVANESVDHGATEAFQTWHEVGESCPEGTVPIRRVSEEDVLRASSIGRFGRKLRRNVRRDSTGSGHEHAVMFVNGNFYGAKASINVWSPRVTDEYEFSLSQLWVISGSFGNDLNTIEAGWQVSPELYGDNYPRFFTYWTTDAYQATGCYNLLCSGFVQTSSRIAIGAAISPRSSYRGRQFDISVMVWKDPKHGHWWLQFGSRLLVGYWPAVLFSQLRSHANMVQFGGEIVNTRSRGYHTSTQMGSGHFPWEGFGKASYFRNLQVVDWDNNLVPPVNLRLLADHPNCYDVRMGRNHGWGTYFYYGGPGRNVRCP